MEADQTHCAKKRKICQMENSSTSLWDFTDEHVQLLIDNITIIAIFAMHSNAIPF